MSKLQATLCVVILLVAGGSLVVAMQYGSEKVVEDAMLIVGSAVVYCVYGVLRRA